MNNNTPKVLFLDIETSPLTGYAWGYYEQNILKILEHCKILSIGYKWQGQKQTTVVGLPDFPGYKAGIVDDKRLVKFIFGLLDEADVIIAHHGDAFDIKKINARFAFYGLGAPSFYKTIDTRKVAYKYFRFDSNKLDELGGYLGEGHKIVHKGFAMWVGCMAGDMKAWSDMKRYNAQDVDLLERVYLRLRPFMTDHPNLNILANQHGLTCPTCLSDNITKRGYAITRAGKKQRFQCGDCGSWSSGPITKANITLR